MDNARLKVTDETWQTDDGVEGEFSATLFAVHVGTGMIVASVVERRGQMIFPLSRRSLRRQ